MARSDKILCLFFLSISISNVCLQMATSQSLVKFLPGFEGPLPFKLETGYVGVGESDEIQLFYYFVESERNPRDDPLMLWLTGGPGCSAISGFLYEIGPLNFNVVEYNGSLPTLVLNPYSWTKVSSIIFVDSPVGTGFSYATNQIAAQSNDFKQVHHLNQFLRKWLMDHPNFLSNPVYIGGDSYSGLTLPILVQDILDGNAQGISLLVDIQGYILGNPLTVRTLEINSEITFAHRMALISDELYESLERNCHGEYKDIDPSNIKCLKDYEYYSECISGINSAHILEPLCVFASPKPQEMSATRRYLDEQLPTIECRTYSYLLSHYWANDGNVQKALNVRKGSIKQWKRCNYGIPYTTLLGSTFQYHVNLSARGCPALVYSGDHDMGLAYFATEAWIKALNYSVVDEWRPWMVQGQVGGYTRSYANKMTFATVKGGGHTAPEYRPQECFTMFKRWISGEPL